MSHEIFFNFLLGPRFKEREPEAESRPLTLKNFCTENNPIFSRRKILNPEKKIKIKILNSQLLLKKILR